MNSHVKTTQCLRMQVFREPSVSLGVKCYPGVFQIRVLRSKYTMVRFDLYLINFKSEYDYFKKLIVVNDYFCLFMCKNLVQPKS